MFQLAAKDNEIQRLLDELSNQLQEYQVHTNIHNFCLFQPASFHRTSWTPKLPWTWRSLCSDAFLSLRKIDSALLVQMPSVKDKLFNYMIDFFINGNKLICHISDDSYDEEDALEHSTPEVKRTVTTNSESNFQRKITVSQTQL